MSSILTGITTSGSPHLGNYVGAIKPSLEKIKESKKSFLFLADYHSLIKQQDPVITQKSSFIRKNNRSPKWKLYSYFP